jgi:hypothetical protein
MLYIRLFERWCKENNLCIAFEDFPRGDPEPAQQ